MAKARRAVLWLHEDGLWRYKVQATNWRTIDSSNIGAKRATIERMLRRRYGDIEIEIIEQGS